MQLDLTTVLSGASTVLTGVLGAWLWLAKTTIANREREIDRRLDDCRAESRQLSERLHTEEKATIQQNGEIARLRDTHDNLASDIHDIRKNMVTKNDWLHLDRLLGEIRQQLSTGRYPVTGGSGSDRYRFGAHDDSGLPPKKDPR